MNKNIKWIVFHGAYDFAYLLKLVNGDGLPNNCMDFYRLMKLYYPNIYDIKYFIKDLPILKDVGLSKLGAEFGVMGFLFSAIVLALSIKLEVIVSWH